MPNENNEMISSKAVKNTDHPEFTDKILTLNALACGGYKGDDFDIDEAVNESQQGLSALGASGGLQEMLIAQMTSIHRLQQRSIAMANEVTNPDSMRYFSSTAIKLSNCFTQQANLLSKLQGNVAQKIVIEHVTVQSGGQAVMANINGGAQTDLLKI